MAPETSYKPFRRAFAMFAVALLAVCALGGIAAVSEDSDATSLSTGSKSSPLSSLSGDAWDMAEDNNWKTFYVSVGGSVRIECNGDQGGNGEFAYNVKSVTSGFGLTYDDSFTNDTDIAYGLVSGTLTKAGTLNVSGDYTNGSASGTWTIAIVAVTSGTLVNSITISGSSSVNVGSTITLTATSSPSSATNRGVTWYLKDGSSYATFVSRDSTDTGGECVIRGIAAGTIIVVAEAEDGSNVKATKTITVKDSSTPVTSVTISGSSSVDVGDSITLRASVYPSSATDRSVTWSIDSGSSYVSIDDNGTSCTVTGVRAGTATIRCEANDGSGEYDTLRITVSSPSYNYNLKFNANGGSGAPSTITKTATDKTSNLKFTIPSTEPTRSGYTFLGWSESSSASSATYTAGDTVYVDYNDLTLYAVWQENKQTYYAYLYYNANGGSGAPSTQSDSIYASSASGSKSFTISSTKPTKSGYDFLGWSTSSNASSASYQPGGSISVSYGSSKTLYAVWKQAEYTSTLIFDANGGSGAPSKLTDTHTSTSAHTFTIPSTKPTRDGFLFKGWSDSKTASAASYQPGATISVPYNGSKTLYAVWEQAKITITSNPALTSLKVGQAWSYTPAASVDGCAVSVSGADWLSASNGKVSGTPTKAGTYTVTITLEKDGYESATQTFTLKVYSALGFDSEPSSKGILTYVSG